VLGEVEETVTTVEIDDETGEELVTVSAAASYVSIQYMSVTPGIHTIVKQLFHRYSSLLCGV
jgi:hypothetical protein